MKLRESHKTNCYMLNHSCINCIFTKNCIESNARQKASLKGRPFGSNPGFRGKYEQNPTRIQLFVMVFTWETIDDNVTEVAGAYPLCWVSLCGRYVAVSGF